MSKLERPEDKRSNRWKTALVIGCALILGLLIGLAMRNLI